VVAASWASGHWLGELVRASSRRGQLDANATPHADLARPTSAAACVFIAGCVVTIVMHRDLFRAWVSRGGVNLTTEGASSIHARHQGDVSIAPDTLYCVNLIRQGKGLAMTSDARVAVLCNKDPVAIDWILWSALIEAGRIRAEPVCELIRNGSFAHIILHFDVSWPVPEYWESPAWPPLVARAVRDRYELQEVFGRFYIYVPRRG
jgi:hypothetical protein